MGKKRVYGEGSVTQRKDGRWQISVPGADGKRRYTYADSKKDAEKERRRLLAEVEQGKVPASRQPFQVHAREWLAMKKRGGGKPNSYINAVSRMDAHFVPALGHIPLNKLTPSHIQKLYNQLLDEGLNPNSLKQYHQTLKSCLDSAVKQGKLNLNPCRNVEIPKKKKSKNNHLERSEALRLLEAVKQHKLFSVLVPLALVTEARESELLALCWDDVDFERGVIRINKTVTREKGEGGHLSLLAVTPKSKSGLRDITLPGFTLDVLRSHKIDQMKQPLVFQNKEKLLFPGPAGGYRWPTSVSTMFTRFANKRGFEITFHDLRHTGATLLLESDVSARAVQERLGHADISTTLRTYGHVTKRMQEKVDMTLDHLFTDFKGGDSEVI